MTRGNDSGDQAQFLRALAFQIRRKQPAAEALAERFATESRGGRHRQWKQAMAVLDDDGFVPALQTAGLVGDEAAVVLAAVADAGDHRLLASAIGALADHLERQT